MKPLAFFFLSLMLAIAPDLEGASKISRFAGYYQGINIDTPVSQFKASQTKEQGGIKLRVGSGVTKRWSFRGSVFNYRVDHIFYFDDYVGTATIRPSTIRFRANLDPGKRLKGMIRITPYGIVISETVLLLDGTTDSKNVYRLRKV
jgi:hypothetical protein